MEERKRLDYLDGLKGIACFLIFIHHFLLLFYPAVHFGNVVISNLNGWDAALSESPLSVIFNGNFFVAVFCVISGVVISLQVMTLKDKDKLASTIAKRYFRLMLPVIPVAIVVFILSRLNAFSNIEASTYTGSTWAGQFYTKEITFEKFIKSTFIETWFYGDNTISGNFWVISKMFFGSFLSMLLSVITWKYNKRAWIIYVFVSICFFDYSDLYLAFTLGTLLAWLIVNKERIFHKIPGVIFLIIGLFLGGYPSGVTPTGIYKSFIFHSYIDLHILGAFMTIYGVLSLKSIRKVLSIKPFIFLGKISYSVYIIHAPFLFSFTSSLFLLLRGSMGYKLNTLIVLIISSLLLVITCYFYNRFVEKSCNNLQNKLFGWLERDKKS